MILASFLASFAIAGLFSILGAIWVNVTWPYLDNSTWSIVIGSIFITVFASSQAIGSLFEKNKRN